MFVLFSPQPHLPHPLHCTSERAVVVVGVFIFVSPSVIAQILIELFGSLHPVLVRQTLPQTLSQSMPFSSPRYVVLVGIYIEPREHVGDSQE